MVLSVSPPDIPGFFPAVVFASCGTHHIPQPFSGCAAASPFALLRKQPPCCKKFPCQKKLLCFPVPWKIRSKSGSVLPLTPLPLAACLYYSGLFSVKAVYIPAHHPELPAVFPLSLPPKKNFHAFHKIPVRFPPDLPVPPAELSVPPEACSRDFLPAMPFFLPFFLSFRKKQHCKEHPPVPLLPQQSCCSRSTSPFRALSGKSPPLLKAPQTKFPK